MTVVMAVAAPALALALVRVPGDVWGRCGWGCAVGDAGGGMRQEMFACGVTSGPHIVHICQGACLHAWFEKLHGETTTCGRPVRPPNLRTDSFSHIDQPTLFRPVLKKEVAYFRDLLFLLYLFHYSSYFFRPLSCSWPQDKKILQISVATSSSKVACTTKVDEATFGSLWTQKLFLTRKVAQK